MTSRGITGLKTRLANTTLNSNDSLTMAFEDNRIVPLLFGKHDENLTLIETRLGVQITPRGNRLAVRGDEAARERSRKVLEDLYARARKGLEIQLGDVEGAIRMSRAGDEPIVAEDDGAIRTLRRTILPRSPNQKLYIEALAQHELVFGTGPAGTGKTYLAVAAGAAALTRGEVDRIILSRPAVEAGERLGFLPGDMKEKVDPYLRPLYDALYDVLPASLVARGMTDGTIEIAPLAFMRGRTLKSAYVILDEAQNTTSQQMKMFLTRLGEGSRMVVTGDPSQVDLPAGVNSGLSEATSVLRKVKGIGHIAFGASDIVRHPLVGRIVEAYDNANTKVNRDR